MKEVILLLSLFIIPGCAFLNSGDKVPVRKEFTISDVKFYGPLWSDIYNKYNIISQDGGSEFEVPGGSIWCFGDTFKGTRDCKGKAHFKGGAVSCSIAFFPDTSAPYPPQLLYLTGNDGTAASPFSFLGDETAEKNSIWPLAGISLNGKYYLYYTLIEKFGKGCWDFKHVADGLSFSDNPLSHYNRIVDNGNWRFPVGPSAIIKTEDWLYLYSIKNTSKHVQGIFLSRVKPDEIENPKAYEYYCGNNIFSKSINREKVMLNKVYGQTSVVWNNFLKKYILASSSSFWEARIIKFYTSDTPSGPWYNTKTTITIPEICQNKKVELAYCAYFHPSLFEKNGKVMYMTYSLLLKDGGFDVNCEMLRFEINKINLEGN